MKYKRILLKLSGESLQGKDKYGINPEKLSWYISQVKEISEMGVQIGIVIGGGNIFRGLAGTDSGTDRLKGDQMGMLATVINSLALESEMLNQDIRAKVFTSIRMEPLGKLYNRDEVLGNMQENIVCILAGGTGNPFFTTDTAAALRAVELNCDALLKGTRVDGVYSADPEKHPDAKKYDHISYKEVISKQLQVMDQTAFTMCRENNMPIIVFNINKAGNLAGIINGNPAGTAVDNE